MAIQSVSVPNSSKLAGRHVPALLLLVLAGALYLFAGMSITSHAAAKERIFAQKSEQPDTYIADQAPPAAEPLNFQNVSLEEAMRYNAAIPVSALPNPAARPFVSSVLSVADHQRSLECLTAAIYYEAATEGAAGQRAVAQVVLNRVRHPAFPDSVCGVVFEGSERSTGCQFTFTCDGSLARAPVPALWARARGIAEAALAGKVYAPAGWATHYHTNWVVPYWSDNLVKLANIGQHIFYRWAGGWGQAPAFANRYSGNEPLFAKMLHIGDGSALAMDMAAAPPEAAMVKRAVFRRFEPVKREDVAALLARQASAGVKIDSGYRWALTGEGGGEDSFGKPAGADEKPAN